MKYIMSFLLPLLLFGETTFITDMEYAAQFYKNPRGIGCQHCHGDSGEGKLIARYIHKDKRRTFKGPVINNLDFPTFFKELNRRKRGMPRYFLTQKEIQALFLHLQKKEIIKNEKVEEQE